MLSGCRYVCMNPSTSVILLLSFYIRLIRFYVCQSASLTACFYVCLNACPTHLGPT